MTSQSKSHKTFGSSDLAFWVHGEYLQACVWFAILFDSDAREVTFVPEALSGEDAAFLREMAQKAVQEFVQVAK